MIETRNHHRNCKEFAHLKFTLEGTGGGFAGHNHIVHRIAIIHTAGIEKGKDFIYFAKYKVPSQSWIMKWGVKKFAPQSPFSPVICHFESGKTSIFPNN